MRKYKILQKRYLSWIVEKLYWDEEDVRPSVFEIMSILLDIPYEPYHPMDSNREEDGLYLRDLYFKNRVDRPEDVVDFDGASVLEVLVELAIRCDSEFIGNPKRPEPYFVFVEMLKNLGIYPGRTCDFFDGFEVREIVKKWMRENPEKVFGLKITKSQRNRCQLWDFMVKWAGNH